MKPGLLDVSHARQQNWCQLNHVDSNVRGGSKRVDIMHQWLCFLEHFGGVVDSFVLLLALSSHRSERCTDVTSFPP